MLFCRKKLSPLESALPLLQQATEIIMSHKRDKEYMPRSEDMIMLSRIEEEFARGNAIASYISRCMEQRLAGEREGAKKYTDAEVARYHNLK